MTTRQLSEAILEGGIRSNNFFNGRLLSGEDLSQEQETNREGHRRLGEAIGDGIAFGLDVSETAGVSTPQSPMITVQPGLAVNREGQTLKLFTRADVSLVRPPEPEVTAPSAFADCRPTQPGVYIAGAGVYLLVIGPASGREGRAPVSGLGNVTAGCNTRYTVEGVHFRLLPLNLSLAELNDPGRLRNRVAYRCFGVGERQALWQNPFGPLTTKYGLLDGLRPHLLTDCDVPLAVIYWAASDGILFVDQWSVRRRIMPRAMPGHFSLLMGDRALSEAEAMLLQFDDQINDMRARERDLRTIIATNRFIFLPPIGLLPISAVGAPSSFHLQTFFFQRASTEVATLEGSRLRPLVNEALYHEPIDLRAFDRIQLYLIWENLQAVERRETDQLALVFASATLPYRGTARFGYTRWEKGRFAPAVI